MTFGKRPADEKNLNGEYVHELWLELGTLNRVNQRLVSEGVLSPRDGNAYTNAALTMSAWRWCINNPVKSYEKTKMFRKAHGEELTMDDWNRELIVHARTSLTPNGYIKFLQGNHLEDKARTVR